MNVLNRLTIKNLKLNRKRTIVTIVGIVLATALLVAVTTIATSMRESLIVRQKQKDGDFHFMLYAVPDDKVSGIENNRYVDSFYTMKQLGYAYLDGSVNNSKPYLNVLALDDKAFESSSIKLTEGRLPVNDSELVISAHIKTNGGVKYNIGDKLTLDLGDREYAGSKLYQNSDYIDGEELVTDTTKTYTIVGICERPGYGEEARSAPGYSVFTSVNSAASKLADTGVSDKNVSDDDVSDVISKAKTRGTDIYLRYNKAGIKDAYRVSADILGVDRGKFESINSKSAVSLSDKEYDKFMEELSKTYAYYLNDWLIRYESNNLTNSSIAFVYNMALVVIVIIIVTSAVCISNSFSISIAEKTKQYGMLASIGATPRQIRRNVLYEAAALGAAGIVAGIISGLFAGYVLVIIANKYIGVFFEMTIVYKISLAGIGIAVILAIFMIFLSSIRPAIRASRMSPIAAIRHSDNIKIKSKKLKTPAYIHKMFGEGGIIAYKNMKRNKSKYRVVTISICISVTVFIAMYSFVSLLMQSAGTYAQGRVDVRALVMSSTLTDEDVSCMIDNINSSTHVSEYSYVRGVEAQFKEKPDYTDDYKRIYKSYMDDSGNNDNAGSNDSDTNYYINIISLGRQQYETFAKKAGLTVDEAKKGGILINKTYQYNEEQKVEYFNIYNYKAGDTLCYKVTGKGSYGRSDITDGSYYYINVVGCVDEKPLGFSNMYASGGYLVVSDEYMNNYFGEDGGSYGDSVININCDDADAVSNILVNDYDIDISNIVNLAQEKRENDGLVMLVSIFLYGFIIVVSLIGVTNIFNTLTTSMELRSREFAMFRSIGMTGREFNRMIRLESIFYGSKSLIGGLILGNVLSYIIYLAQGSGSGMTYNIPVAAIIISVVAVILLIYFIMQYSLIKIKRQNIIETIRGIE